MAEASPKETEEKYLEEEDCEKCVVCLKKLKSFKIEIIINKPVKICWKNMKVPIENKS